MSKTEKRLNAMLDNALSARPIESGFDESTASQMESKLHRILLQSHTHKQQLEEEKARINELVSDISHQTKTPLSSILLYTELLLECDSEAEKERYGLQLKQQTEKLQFLVSSLVKLSRLENGIIAPKPKRQSLHILLCGLQESFADVCVKACKAQACYDLKWTHEAVCNLLDNAQKYGASEITVSVREYELFCKLDVQDNGMGIAEGEAAKVFQRFYRAENAKDSEGVGLGLHLSREIVVRQGGYIRLQSAPGQGSTFSVFLPKA